jgi:hypothetical protein
MTPLPSTGLSMSAAVQAPHLCLSNIVSLWDRGTRDRTRTAIATVVVTARCRFLSLFPIMTRAHHGLERASEQHFFRVPRRLLVPRVDAAQDQADTVVETGGNPPHRIHSLPRWILYQRR